MGSRPLPRRGSNPDRFGAQAEWATGPARSRCRLLFRQSEGDEAAASGASRFAAACGDEHELAAIDHVGAGRGVA